MGTVERRERESRKLMKGKLENSTMTRTLMSNRFTADDDEFPSLINDKAESLSGERALRMLGSMLNLSSTKSFKVKQKKHFYPFCMMSLVIVVL